MAKMVIPIEENEIIAIPHPKVEARIAIARLAEVAVRTALLGRPNQNNLVVRVIRIVNMALAIRKRNKIELILLAGRC